MTVALLDTHAFVWAVSDPDRLGPAARATIEDPANQLLVSAATGWEIATKVRIGRWPHAEQIAAQYEALVDALRAAHLPISATHTVRAGGMPWSHRDPFDRMLAAQALLEHAVLLSRDRMFSTLGGVDVRW